MLHLQEYVYRAAEEFRAADNAGCPKSADAHREMACEFIHLIKCDGSQVSYRLLRARRLRALEPVAGAATSDLPVLA